MRPKCPACGGALARWAGWRISHDTPIRCPSCAALLRPNSLTNALLASAFGGMGAGLGFWVAESKGSLEACTVLALFVLLIVVLSGALTRFELRGENEE